MNPAQIEQLDDAIVKIIAAHDGMITAAIETLETARSPIVSAYAKGSIAVLKGELRTFEGLHKIISLMANGEVSE